MIKKEEIEKMARLARLSAEEDEIMRFSGEVAAVLDYVAAVQEVKTDLSDGPVVGKVFNVMRADGQPHDSGKYTKELLAAAPSREGNFVKVKKVISLD